MAKKKTQSRKAPRTSTPRMYSSGAPAQPTATTVQQTGRSTGASTSAASRPTVAAARGTLPMEQQYAYVMGDLKRLGLVALGMFVFLIALGVILPR